jgi:hypothetical protein
VQAHQAAEATQGAEAGPDRGAEAGPAARDTPTPDGRARRGATGIPVTLTDGRTWLLPRLYYTRQLDELRDRLFDDLVARHSVRIADVRLAAFILLCSNYRLGRDEAFRLLAVPAPEIKDAVIDALIPPACESLSVSDWTRSALLANGIKPDDVPGEDLPAVLAQLEAAGRIAPASRFSAAAAHAAAVKSLLG